MTKRKSLREVVSENLGRLMAANPELRSGPLIDKRAKKLGYTLGSSTVDRIRNRENALTVDTLQAVADACGIEAWQLLAEEEGLAQLSEEAIRFATLFDRLNPVQQAAVMVSIRSYAPPALATSRQPEGPSTISAKRLTSRDDVPLRKDKKPTK